MSGLQYAEGELQKKERNCIQKIGYVTLVKLTNQND